MQILILCLLLIVKVDMFVFFLQWTSQAFLQREQCVRCRFFVRMILLYWRQHAEGKKAVGFNPLAIKDLRQLLLHMGVLLITLNEITMTLPQ